MPVSPPSRSRAARMTGSQRGAVATIRLWDSADVLTKVSPPLFRPRRNIDVAAIPINQLLLGDWGTAPAEEVVLCRVSQDVFEIHCHGGEQAVARIAEYLQKNGVEWVDWPTMVNSEQGLLAAEWTAAITRATTSRTATWLMPQQGRMEAAVRTLQQLTHRCASSATATDVQRGAESELFRRLAELDRWSRFGLHLSTPWSVVLAGRTNVGKSSLINALVGFKRSIVSDQPGTTRDVVTADTACDGWPICFSDTAGLRQSTDDLETEGMRRARARFSQADARLLLFDYSQPVGDLEEQLLREFPDAIQVAHKCDLRLGCDIAHLRTAVPVSSQTGHGVAELLQTIADRLVPQRPPSDVAFPVNSRQANLISLARQHAAARRWEHLAHDLVRLLTGD